jgi:uncharacterized protein (TIGR00251 family)
MKTKKPMPKLVPKAKRIQCDSFFYWDGDVLVFNVLGKPSASKDEIGKVKGRQLKISVTETPTRGRATDHMVKFLAKVFDVSIADIEVVFGRMNVNKQIRVRRPKRLPEVFSS